MAIFGMLIHMTVDFPLQAPANAAYFVVFLALAWIVNNIKAYTGSRTS
jgi:putative inorganic carbon (HCO3(-)) transporter